MTLRSPGWRTASGFAALVPILMLAGFSGCRWLPKRHPVPSIDPRTVSKPGVQASELAPLEAVSGTSNLAEVPLPPLPLRPVSDAEALAAVPTEPTPQLDQALQKAQALDHAFMNGLDAEADRAPALILLPGTGSEEPPRTPGAEPMPETGMPALLPTPALDPATRRDEAVLPASFPAGASSAVMPKSSEPGADADTDWNGTLERLLNLASEQAEKEPAPGPWTARRKLLERLAEADARERADSQEPLLWETVLTILAEAEERDAEPEAEADADAEPQVPSLSIADLRLCRQVTGFGQYEPAMPSDIRTGRELMLYWEVEGFQTVQENDLYRTLLASELEILPEQGESPLWSRAFNDPEDLCRRPRRDYFVNYRLTIPNSLSPGKYRLRLRLQDRQSSQTAERELSFELAP